MLASFWVLAATFLTVLTYVFVKLAPPDIPAADIFFLRSIFLFGCMAALLLTNKVSPVPRRPGLMKFHALRCTAGITALYINITAAQHLPIATAQTLAYSSSLFIGAYVVIRGMLARQKSLRLNASSPVNPAFPASPLNPTSPTSPTGLTFPGRALPATILAGFGGVVLTLRPSFDAALGFYGALALVSALCTAVASLTLKAIGTRGEPVLRTAFWFAVFSLVFSSILWGTTSERLIHELFCVPELLAVGICTVLSQLAQTKAWGHGHPLLCASLGFSAIIFSVVFGMTVFGETFDACTSLGIALILTTEVAATVIQMRGDRAAKSSCREHH